MKLRRIAIIAILLFVLAFASFSTLGQEPFLFRAVQEFNAAFMRESVPAFTAEEAQSIALEVIPLVEQITGKKFKQIPEIAIVNRSQVISVLRSESTSDKNLPQSDGDVDYTSIATGLLGMYGKYDKTLYLLPGNLPPIMGFFGTSILHTEPLTKLVIAHELTHALQDQEVDLARFLTVTNSDKLHAFSATFEGHAVFIHDQVGRILGIDETLIELSKILSSKEPTMYENPLLRRDRMAQNKLHDLIYWGGRDFIDYHFQRGGNALLWEILSNPPVKSSMILEPSTYSHIVEEKGDGYAALLDGVEQYLGIQQAKVSNAEIGRMMIEANYAMLPDADRQNIIPAIRHVQTLIVESAHPQLTVKITFMLMTDRDVVQGFCNAMEQIAQDDYKAINQVIIDPTGVVTIEFLITDLAAMDADMARKITYSAHFNTDRFQSIMNLFKDITKDSPPPADTPPIPEPESSNLIMKTIIRICRGPAIIEIEFSGSGAAVEDAQIVSLAEEVFARYEQMLAAEANNQ